MLSEIIIHYWIENGVRTIATWSLLAQRSSSSGIARWALLAGFHAWYFSCFRNKEFRCSFSWARLCMFTCFLIVEFVYVFGSMLQLLYCMASICAGASSVYSLPVVISDTVITRNSLRVMLIFHCVLHDSCRHKDLFLLCWDSKVTSSAVLVRSSGAPWAHRIQSFMPMPKCLRIQIPWPPSLNRKRDEI